MNYLLVGLITAEQHMSIQHTLGEAARLASLARARVRKLQTLKSEKASKAERVSPRAPMNRGPQEDVTCNPPKHLPKTQPNSRTGTRGPDRESLNPAL